MILRSLKNGEYVSRISPTPIVAYAHATGIEIPVTSIRIRDRIRLSFTKHRHEAIPFGREHAERIVNDFDELEIIGGKK